MPHAQLGRLRVVCEDVLVAGGLVAGREVAGGDLPPAAGAWTVDDGGATFVPRYPFVAGRRYALVVDGEVIETLERPGESSPSGIEVARIFPSGGAVPRNLLRLYVWFTGRMGDGRTGGIRLDGASDAFLPVAEELWDPARTRLTLFLDPARIKRGLVSHEALGYPLRHGQRVRLVIDGMHDATGAPVEPWAAELEVGPDLRHRLDPARWRISAPRAGSRDPLHVTFDRAMDHALLQRTITAPVPGASAIGPAERSWTFVPDEPWSAGDHALVVSTILEDVAGNSLRRAFDRDLADPQDDPLDAATVRVPFHVT